MYTPIVPDLEAANTGGEEELKKGTRQRGWVSLGSEAEIDMEIVIPTREKVIFQSFKVSDSCAVI